MIKIGNLLGWIAVCGYAAAIFSYFTKYINNGNIRRFIIRYHKTAGIVSFIALIGHVYIMYSMGGISIPGIIGAVTMLSVVALGIYIPKVRRSSWIKVHIILSFILAVLIVIHIMFKDLLLIY